MAKEKVYVGVFYEVVVVTKATTKQAAARTLRSVLAGRYRDETSTISLLNHVAIVYWSGARGAYWYRFAEEPVMIHPARVDATLRPFVATREPTKRGWGTDHSASHAP